MPIYRLNSAGNIKKVLGFYRVNSAGSIKKISQAFRLNTNGVFKRIFVSQVIPTVKNANPPLLYFRDSSGNETTSKAIETATNSNQTSPAAFNGDKIYLTRGKWNDEPLEFVMKIEKDTNSSFTSPTLVNASSERTITYSSYSDNDENDQVPQNSTNRYTITKQDVRDGYYFRGYIEATNFSNETGQYPTPYALPRMYVSAINFNQNLDNTYGTNIQTNGGTFTWSYTGSIVAADVDTQEFFVYPYNNTSGNALYSTSIFPGTSTTSAPTSTTTFTNVNLEPNTQYTIVIRATMKDGWKDNSTVSLRTIVSDQESFTTKASVPDIPVITSASDVGTNRAYDDSAVSLAWSQPGSIAATGYKIENAEGPSFEFWVVQTANTNSATTSGTFGGLKSNTSYKFRVSAINANGTSDPSAASSSVTLTTVPKAPTSVSAIAGDAQADVSYTATPNGFNGGKSIQYYRATSNPGSITSTEVISPITVTGLTNYTSYTFTVAAYNANGFSVESTASASVTPQLPAPVGSGTVTIASDSSSNYVYKITSYGTWSNSATKYDYQWQTSSDNSTWTTRQSGTDVATIPDYNAATYKGQFIRLRVFGRNQTGPSISPLVSNTLTIFYTTPVINSFSVTGSELFASWTYSYSTDDPSPVVYLDYKLSSNSTWSAIVLPTSPGNIQLPPGTYDFRLMIMNSANGAFRVATQTVSSIVVLSFYSFSFGNTLYPSTNGYIGLSGGSTSISIPGTGKYLGILPGDFTGNTSATTGYMLAWSDSTKYVIRFDGYRLGFFGQASYRLEWMATFYSNQNYVDVKIITRGSNISGSVTIGIFKDGVVVAGIPAPYVVTQGMTFRLNYDGTVGSTGISYDEISITSPNDIMNTAGSLTGTNDDGYYTITTTQNYYKSPTVTVGTISGGTSTLSIPFTESNGCDYITYNVRTTSHSGTIVQSGSSLTTPLSLSSLTANTTYYITFVPYNYKNQSGTQVQFTSTTAPPQPTVSFSSITSSSFTVNWSATGATHYYVDIYNSVSGVSLFGYPVSNTTGTSASISGLSSYTSYTVTVYARNSFNGFLGDPRTVSQTTNFSALTPTFGTNTAGDGQFTGSVTNYDTNYTWSPSVSLGTFTWGTQSGSTRPFTVSSLSDGQSSTVTMGTSRSGYDNGSAQTTGNALFAALTPTFGTNTSIGGGFTGSVTNYDSSYTWSPSVNSGTFTWGTQSGSTRPFTVSGLSSGASSTVTMGTSRSGYKSGSAETTGTASVISAPTGGSVSLSGSGVAGTSITATTSGWTGSPTSYSVNIRRSISSPVLSSDFSVASSTTSSVSYTITVTDANPPPYIYKAFATATNSGGTSSIVSSSEITSSRLAQPTGLFISYQGWNGTQHTWSASWNAVTGASSYTAYREVAAQPGTPIGNTSNPQTGLTGTSTTFSTTNFSYDWARFYVKAVNSLDDSGYAGPSILSLIHI